MDGNIAEHSTGQEQHELDPATAAARDAETRTTTIVSLDGTESVYTYSRSRRRSSFWHQPEATVFSSTMNLSKTAIGAGMLSLPYAFANTGFVLGTLLLVIFTIFTVITLHLGMAASTMIRMPTYSTMCEATLPQLQVVVDLSVAATCFGLCLAYLIIIGDNMSLAFEHIIGDIFVSDRRFMITLFLLIFIVPTVRLRKLDALRFTSMFAIMCFVYVILVVLIYTNESLDPCKESPDSCGRVEPFPEPGKILSFFKAAPIIIYAFTCHQNAYAITSELERPTLLRLNQTIGGSIGFCALLYAMFGFAGYYTFGHVVSSNLLNDYPHHGAILVLRIGLSIALAFSYPLQMRPIKNAMSSLFLRVPDAKELPDKQFHIVTWTLVGISYVISMITNDLGLVLGVIGGTGANIIVFVLPGLFYYYMPHAMLKENPYHEMKKKLSIVCVVVGLILMPFTVTMQFVDL